MALSEKQRRFCEEYMIDLNATQAAIRAGYSPASAAMQASCLLRKPNIANEIDTLRAEESKRTGVTIDRIIRELAKYGFGSEPVDRSADRIRALELLGKHFGAFQDRMTMTVDMPELTVGVIPNEPEKA